MNMHAPKAVVDEPFGVDQQIAQPLEPVQAAFAGFFGLGLGPLPHEQSRKLI